MNVSSSMHYRAVTGHENSYSQGLHEQLNLSKIDTLIAHLPTKTESDREEFVATNGDLQTSGVVMTTVGNERESVPNGQNLFSRFKSSNKVLL